MYKRQADYCGENGERFILLNQWLGKTFETEQQIVFPYGNQYGWGVAHRKKRKLLCNVFAAVSYTHLGRNSENETHNL